MGEKFPILKISCLQLRAAMIYVWMHQWNRFSVKKDIFFPVLYFQPLYNFDFFFYLNFLLHSFAALRCSSVHVLPLQQLSICESCKLWSNNLLSSTTIQSCRDWRFLSGKGTSWVKQFCPNISLIWEKQKKKKKKTRRKIESNFEIFPVVAGCLVIHLYLRKKCCQYLHADVLTLHSVKNIMLLIILLSFG